MKQRHNTIYMNAVAADEMDLFVHCILFDLLTLGSSLQVIVPLPSWDLKTKEPLTADPEKYAIETELIFKYSPFKNEQQLMEQFNKIESSNGKH